jgi:spermidine/putrescine transport system substrate-binding protein
MSSGLSRRSLLRGGAALGVAAATGSSLASCAYIGDGVVKAPEPKPSVKAKIDGDLVYFNWADYLDPAVFKGFKKEYGVDIIESNYDSMEGMYAKVSAGNRYDIIFPGAKWVAQLKQQGKLSAIDHRQLQNADQVFGGGSYFADPWYDKNSEVSAPFTVYKTGIAWRKDKVDSMTGSWRDLWNEDAKGRIFVLDNQDEALGMAALLLGFDVNTSKTSELAEIKKLLLSQKPLLRAYSSDDINNMASGDPWIHHMWSGDFVYFSQYVAKHPERVGFEAPREGAPINSDAYAIPANAEHPGTAMLFIDYLLRPEIAKKNINYLCYPFPVRDAVGEFEKLAKQYPACNVDVNELENAAMFKLLTPQQVQARSAVWTEVKAS